MNDPQITDKKSVILKRSMTFIKVALFGVIASVITILLDMLEMATLAAPFLLASNLLSLISCLGGIALLIFSISDGRIIVIRGIFCLLCGIGSYLLLAAVGAVIAA